MKIGLVGNQNSGKTTLFNLLTGSHAKIGNWPGVTIEKKVGKIKNTKHELIDLPGIYSLSPYSTEEEISRKFIFDEKPDVIINILDSTSLERSLYLTTQLIELDTRVIAILNMAEIASKRGIEIDEKKLEKELGIPVIKVDALKGTGIENLLNELNKNKKNNNIKIFDKNIELSINEISKQLNNNKRFIAIKTLERDKRFNDIDNRIISDLESKYLYSLEEEIATQRYRFIEKVKKECVKTSKKNNTVLSDKLDKIFLNKFLSFPIFIIIMFLVYYLSVGVVGSSNVDMISAIMESISEIIENFLVSINASDILISLIIDGVIAGVGAVLGFIPQLIILFTCIVLLETTGYMSRISLLLDKLFRKIGLSGKSLIPFIVGSGCSVPGIMGTRIIENNDEREMTSILVPFIPCSAKLPIIALFSGYFFKENSGLVSASLYFFAIIIIIIFTLVLKKFKYKNISSSYISELPEYRVPSIRYVLTDVYEKVISFVKRAGSIILLCSIIIWFLLSFSFKLKYGVGIENSILATIGKIFSWIFYPMLGENNWGACVSAMQGLVAKEQVVSSMAVIAGIAQDTEEGAMIFGSTSPFSGFTPASAYAYMVFNLFSAPCFGAIGAMKKELGSTKKLLKVVCTQTSIAWLLGIVVYQIGSRLSSINIANIIIILILINIVILIINNMRKNKNKCSNCPYCSSCNKGR